MLLKFLWYIDKPIRKQINSPTHNASYVINEQMQTYQSQWSDPTLRLNDYLIL